MQSQASTHIFKSLKFWKHTWIVYGVLQKTWTFYKTFTKNLNSTRDSIWDIFASSSFLEYVQLITF